MKPAKPDARLGAGGIRPNTGNVIYPGTPGVSSVGNILTPGTPSVAHPIPPIVPQPVAQPSDPATAGDVKHKHPRGRGRRFAGDYPVYGFFAYPFVPNVIAVDGSTMTRSGSGYVVTVGDEEPAEQTAEIKPAETVEPDYWLIALRGGLIYAVSDYSIESRALRFVTLQGDEYVVPLAELDRDFTVKLNLDRNVKIELD